MIEGEDMEVVEEEAGKGDSVVIGGIGNWGMQEGARSIWQGSMGRKRIR